MAFNRSDLQRNSRYNKGGSTELRGNRLGFWERRIFPRSPTDVPYIISPRYHLRADLLAADLYGRDDLMWFILDYNTIVDLHTEFVQGASISLPTRTRLFTQLLTNSA